MTQEILNARVLLFPVGTGAYVMINGELTKVMIVCTKFFVDGYRSCPVVRFPDKTHHVLTTRDTLYASVYDYENDNDISVRETTVKNLLPFSGKSYWVMEDGEPVEKSPIFDMMVCYTNSKETLIDGKPMPTEWYKTREECIKWNDITIVEGDGTKRVQKSVYRRLLLTDAQKAKLQELKQAFDELKAAGITLVFNNEDCEFYALNTSEAESKRFEWQGEQHKKEDEVLVDDYFMHNEYMAGLSSWYRDESKGLFCYPSTEDDLLIKFKED